MQTGGWILDLSLMEFGLKLRIMFRLHLMVIYKTPTGVIRIHRQTVSLVTSSV